MPIIASIESETGRLRRCASIDRRIAEFGGVYRPFSSFSSSPRGTHFLRHKLVDLAFRIDFYQNLETFRIFLEVRAREKLQYCLGTGERQERKESARRRAWFFNIFAFRV